MALSLYKVLTPYSLTINGTDLTGAHPATLTVAPGNVFVADSGDPTIVSLLSSGAIGGGNAASVGAVPVSSLPTGIAGGLATLNGSVKVVQDPADATATPTASKIPLANGSGKLAAGWGGSANTLATLDGAGVLPVAQLPNGAGIAALLAGGLGASADYPKTTVGAQTLLAADAGNRSVIIVAIVTEVFADGDGTQPTFQIGETTTANKFADTAVFTGAAAGTVFTFAGTLTGTKNFLVTGVAATGTTSTGALAVTVLALPA